MHSSKKNTFKIFMYSEEKNKTKDCMASLPLTIAGLQPALYFHLVQKISKFESEAENFYLEDKSLVISDENEEDRDNRFICQNHATTSWE